MLEGPERVLADIARRLRDFGKPFALVGGLAVSVRGEVRFTRDVDLALAVADDTERGFDRNQDLDAKLDDLLREAREAAE